MTTIEPITPVEVEPRYPEFRTIWTHETPGNYGRTVNITHLVEASPHRRMAWMRDFSGYVNREIQTVDLPLPWTYYVITLSNIPVEGAASSPFPYPHMHPGVHVGLSELYAAPRRITDKRYRQLYYLPLPSLEIGATFIMARGICEGKGLQYDQSLTQQLNLQKAINDFWNMPFRYFVRLDPTVVSRHPGLVEATAFHWDDSVPTMQDYMKSMNHPTPVNQMGRWEALSVDEATAMPWGLVPICTVDAVEARHNKPSHQRYRY